MRTSNRTKRKALSAEDHRTLCPARAHPSPKPRKQRSRARFLKYAKIHSSTAIQRIKANSANNVRKLASKSCQALQPGPLLSSGIGEFFARRCANHSKMRATTRRTVAARKGMVRELIFW